MKKLTSFLPIFLLSICAASAQQADTARLIVHYKFSHVRDTTRRDKPYTENMVLFLGQNASVYKSFDKKTQDAMMRKQVADQVAAQKGSGGPISINIVNHTPTTNTEYYQFAAQGKFVRKESLITPYLIEEPMPLINWKISADTLTIGGIHCQKATGHFKGRDYTAWFSPDIPFHAGPWKLNGLPGLIVEVYDKNKEVVFKFDSMEEAVKGQKAADAPEDHQGMMVKMVGMDDPNADPNVIAVPTDAVKTTEKEFNNLRDAMRKNPSSAMAGFGGGNFKAAPNNAAGGGGPQITSVRINGGGPEINNPLELPERK